MNDNMKGIDVIIPVHKYNDNISVLLKRCLTSVNEMADNVRDMDIKIDVHVVGIPDLLSKNIKNILDTPVAFDTFEVYENKTENYDFCSQVNFAVEEICKNDFFMVVEFDDMVTSKWLRMAMPYIKEYKKCPLFLPLVEVYDITNPTTPLHYINEIGWSSSFTENELGVLTTDLLKDYCNFNVTGAIIRRNDFIKAGGLKASIKLSFGYELLLRLSNLCNNVFVVPKVGYFHFVNREDSLTSEYHNTMSKKEGAWWIQLAIEEYQYKKDRNKIYTPEKDEE